MKPPMRRREIDRIGKINRIPERKSTKTEPPMDADVRRWRDGEWTGLARLVQ